MGAAAKEEAVAQATCKGAGNSASKGRAVGIGAGSSRGRVAGTGEGR